MLRLRCRKSPTTSLIRRLSVMSLNPHKAYSLSPIPGAETLADGTKAVDAEDWVERLELEAVSALHRQRDEKLKVLVLYGSLRER
jgi:hypothetical protein